MIEIIKKNKDLFTFFYSNNSTDNNTHSHEDEQDSLKNKVITGSLEYDIQECRIVFENSSDIVYREFQASDQNGMLIFLDGFVNTELIDSNILKPILNYKKDSVNHTGNHFIKSLFLGHVITAAKISSGQTVQDITDHVLSGDTALLIDGVPQALFINLQQWDKRNIEEPSTEAVVRGPRDGFTENLQTNKTLIRRRLKTPRLKMELIQIGKLSKTNIIITYLEGIADDSLVVEIRKRINRIDIDAILESGYIEELIMDNPFSIFPQVGCTERPDKVVGNILEGHVGILIDNTPLCLIAPQTFFQFLQSAEDYYLRYPVSSCIRILRFLFLFISLFFPSLYIAITTFHQEMIPTNLLLSVAASSDAVPFPAFIEALIMEISFEGLREAGVRIPRPVGQTVSIVGALIIGQAAVQAGIVSNLMVIIVALTGIAAFINPSYGLGNSIRILRFPMMILAGTMGLYGILLGTIALQIHLCRLRSFGIPYFSPVAPMNINSILKDVIIRSPKWAVIKRSGLVVYNKTRRRNDP